MRTTARTELLAAPAEVWAFLAEPYNLADWWPGLRTVQPDRRGLAEGARWTVRTGEASLFRRAAAEDTLLVRALEPEARFAFELARARISADLQLAPAANGRTTAQLVVEEPFSFGFRRGRRAKDALDRLRALVQTGAVW